MFFNYIEDDDQIKLYYDILDYEKKYFKKYIIKLFLFACVR